MTNIAVWILSSEFQISFFEFQIADFYEKVYYRHLPHAFYCHPLCR